MRPAVPPEGGEVDLPSQQRMDLELVEIFDYITKDALPRDPKRAQKLSSRCTVLLYFIEKDKTLRVIPPVSSCRQLFEDANSDTYGGHLREAKIHGQLSVDIIQFPRSAAGNRYAVVFIDYLTKYRRCFRQQTRQHSLSPDY